MFGFTIRADLPDLLVIGRTAIGPLYFMHRSGEPMRRWAWDGWTPEHGEQAKEKDRERREAYKTEQRALQDLPRSQAK